MKLITIIFPLVVLFSQQGLAQNPDYEYQKESANNNLVTHQRGTIFPDENLTESKFTDFVQWADSSNQYLPPDTELYRDSFIEAFWDTISNSWINELKEEFVYNQIGYPIIIIRSTWNDSIGNWTYKEKEEYTFYGNNNGSHLLIFSWDNSTNQWKPTIKEEAFFEINGRKIQYLRSTFDHIINKWIPTAKTEEFYDQNGWQTMEIRSEFSDTLERWIDYFREDFVYDTYGNAILFTKYDFDSNLQMLFPSNAYHRQFLPSGMLLESIEKKWVKSIGEWENVEKYTYERDFDENITQYSKYNWNKAQLNWDLYRYEKNTYDSLGQIIQIIYGYGIHPSFPPGPYRKVNLSYDSIGNKTIYINSFWNSEEEIFEPENKEEYFYNVFQEWSIVLISKWDSEEEEWQTNKKTEYIYDEDGNLTQKLFFEIHPDDNTILYLQRKFEYVYNNRGQEILYQRSYYFLRGDTWTVDFKRTQAFNNRGLIISHEVYTIPSGTFEGLMPSRKNNYTYDRYGNLTKLVYSIRDGNTDGWVPVSRRINFYPGQNPTGISEVNLENVIIFPNPTSDYVQINLDPHAGLGNFEIFDLNGIRVLSQKVGNQERINLSRLFPGVYLFTLQQGGYQKSGRLLKN